MLKRERENKKFRSGICDNMASERKIRDFVFRHVDQAKHKRKRTNERKKNVLVNIKADKLFVFKI